MAEFRTLSADDVREILDAFEGLGASSYRSHAPVAAGTINTNVRVETTAGTFFLRINEGKTRDDVAREAAIVSHAAARGVPTPAPLRRARRRGLRRLARRARVGVPVGAGPHALARRGHARARRARGRARSRRCTSRATATPITAPAATSPTRSAAASSVSRASAAPSSSGRRSSSASRSTASSASAPRPCPRASSTAISSSTTCFTTPPRGAEPAAARRCWTSSRRRGGASPTTSP